MGVSQVVVRSAYAYDADLVSEETGLKCEDQSLALQSQRDESDINVIVKRFGITGMVPVRQLPELDFVLDGVFDFQEMMNYLNEAKASYMSLPADVRGRFLNDPSKFVDFVLDPANIDEVVKLGLAVPKPKAPEPQVMKVEVVNPPEVEE